MCIKITCENEPKILRLRGGSFCSSHFAPMGFPNPPMMPVCSGFPSYHNCVPQIPYQPPNISYQPPNIPYPPLNIPYQCFPALMYNSPLNNGSSPVIMISLPNFPQMQNEPPQFSEIQQNAPLQIHEISHNEPFQVTEIQQNQPVQLNEIDENQQVEISERPPLQKVVFSLPSPPSLKPKPRSINEPKAEAVPLGAVKSPIIQTKPEVINNVQDFQNNIVESQLKEKQVEYYDMPEESIPSYRSTAKSPNLTKPETVYVEPKKSPVIIAETYSQNGAISSPNTAERQAQEALLQEYRRQANIAKIQKVLDQNEALLQKRREAMDAQQNIQNVLVENQQLEQPVYGESRKSPVIIAETYPQNAAISMPVTAERQAQEALLQEYRKQANLAKIQNIRGDNEALLQKRREAMDAQQNIQNVLVENQQLEQPVYVEPRKSPVIIAETYPQNAAISTPVTAEGLAQEALLQEYRKQANLAKIQNIRGDNEALLQKRREGMDAQKNIQNVLVENQQLEQPVYGEPRRLPVIIAKTYPPIIATSTPFTAERQAQEALLQNNTVQAKLTKLQQFIDHNKTLLKKLYAEGVEAQQDFINLIKREGEQLVNERQQLAPVSNFHQNKSASRSQSPGNSNAPFYDGYSHYSGPRSGENKTARARLFSPSKEEKKQLALARLQHVLKDWKQKIQTRDAMLLYKDRHNRDFNKQQNLSEPIKPELI